MIKNVILICKNKLFADLYVVYDSVIRFYGLVVRM